MTTRVQRQAAQNRRRRDGEAAVDRDRRDHYAARSREWTRGAAANRRAGQAADWAAALQRPRP